MLEPVGRIGMKLSLTGYLFPIDIVAVRAPPYLIDVAFKTNCNSGEEKSSETVEVVVDIDVRVLVDVEMTVPVEVTVRVIVDALPPTAPATKMAAMTTIPTTIIAIGIRCLSFCSGLKGIFHMPISM
jgi:hypothetical protein